MLVKLVDFVVTSVIGREEEARLRRRKERGGTREMLEIGLVQQMESPSDREGHLSQERARIRGSPQQCTTFA